MDRIVKILEVVDTRTWEEGADDKWYPIPGSGIEHECDRCGRFHEIHAAVLLESGRTAIVGTGCMGRENLEMAKRFQRADRAAKKLAELKARLIPAVATDENDKRIWAEVEGLSIPQITQGVASWDPTMPTIRMEDVEIAVHDLDYFTQKGYYWEGRRRETEQSLIRNWQANRAAERGYVPGAAEEVRDLLRQIEATERRLSEIMEES